MSMATLSEEKISKDGEKSISFQLISAFLFSLQTDGWEI